jgi:DNA-binding MarR family transcriptional regulator
MRRTDTEDFVIGAVSLLSNRFSRFADSLHKDITFKQWFLLMMISRMGDDPKNVRDIAEYTGTSRQNVKKMLASLEKKDYVTCSRSSEDGRALHVDLTDKAYRYFEENDDLAARKTNELFEPISNAELNTIVASLRKLMECLDAYEGVDDEDEE